LNMDSSIVKHQFACMASDVVFHLASPQPGYVEALAQAELIFKNIEKSCTRFNPQSALMLANRQPSEWHEMPSEAIEIISKAYEAYLYTHGVFDPRILQDLVQAGYDTSISFTLINKEKEIKVSSTLENQNKPRAVLPQWNLEISEKKVLLGALPIDLGGIGKGCAVSSALEILKNFAQGVMVEAGGDIAVHGKSAPDLNWRIGVEDPWDVSSDPLTVIEIESGAIATSSLRLRRWIHNGVQQHHLIDPKTGVPGGDGLMAVSVIHEFAYVAEVWSKSLFLSGVKAIEIDAAKENLAVAWVTQTGELFYNKAFEAKVIWKSESIN
jgi:thiamine biosynthesis lipoprotein